MYNFSEEELLEIARYPKQVYEYACKQMQAMYNAHKPVKAPFKWFIAVCDNYVQKQANKNPTTGNAAETQQTKLRNQAQAYKFQRTRANWQESMPVVNHPDCRQAEVKFVETELEWTSNVERKLHERMTTDPTFHPAAAKYANPLWDKLSADQQSAIMKDIHIDCNCRQTVDRSLPIAQAVRDGSSQPGSVTERHTLLNSDDRIMIPTIEAPYIDDQSDWEEI